MPDIIALLPDAVANQIAAGEVIQRPASVVKELLENAIDAGSTRIQLNVLDAGKTLIQVIDNGCGMSETDARLSFERHATSKIRDAQDLFAIRTKGFRGEALASMAAIAHVELKTRQCGEELGTHIVMEGSVVKSQEPCQCPEGTSFSIKNLFFNVPARRNFLKSNQVELRHIMDEFQRVALTHPEVEFVMHHNQNEVFNLPIGSDRQRIVGVMGKNHNQRLVPVDESTDIVRLTGFVGKPEFARKTRGEQFFFVNKRFIKSSYLNHAVVKAYEELIPKGHFPSYFIFMDIDPSTIDVNIHPTKTEIKFEDEKAIYAIMLSSVRQSLGKYNIAPSLDFEQETSFNVKPLGKNQPLKAPSISFNPNYNPFEQEKGEQHVEGLQRVNTPSRPSAEKWEDLHTINRQFETDTQAPAFPDTEIVWDEDGTKSHEVEVLDEGNQQVLSAGWESGPESIGEDEQLQVKITVQLHRRYILTHIKSGFLIINQHRAHERVLFERLLKRLDAQSGHCQQLLFPVSVNLQPSDFVLLAEMMDDVRAMGFELSSGSDNEITISGVPADAGDTNVEQLLEGMLEQYKHNVENLTFDRREKLAYALADRLAIKSGQRLESEEMNNLIDELFACELPYYSPSGLPVVLTYTLDELEKRFSK